MKNYEFHEVANIFPMMNEVEFAGLIDDIRKNGQREPVWIHEDKIVDGRNRYRACLELDIPVAVREWDGKGSLVDFVVSLNFHRRSLSEAQRAMVGDKIKHIFVEEARLRQVEHLKQGDKPPSALIQANGGDTGRSAEKAAQLVNSSKSSIEAAGRVRKKGLPEVAEAVESGKVSLYKADAIASYPQEEQPELLTKALAGETIVKKTSKPVSTPEPAPSPEPQPTPAPTPQPQPAFMEGAEALQEVLQNISLQLSLLVGQAETELLNLPKSTVKRVQYQVGACVDAIHKNAERLEISLKMSK